MSKTQEISPENIKQVLLNNGFNKDNDNKYFNDAIEVHFNYYPNNYAIKVIGSDNPSTITDYFDIFILAIKQYGITLTPLPVEEPIMEWWEKNKVEGFNFYEHPDDSYYIESKSLMNWEKQISPGTAQISKAWSDERIKSTILKLCELFKD